MSEGFIPRAISRVRVALYGPSGVGKTLFKNMLLKRDASPPEPTEKPDVAEVLRDYKRPTEFGVSMSVEKYKLTLVDVPGKPEYKDERIGALSKIVGWMFMYDATDPKSPEELMRMIKEELEPARKLKSAIAIMVIGTKKDLGVNDEAVKKGEEIAKYLSKHTSLLYGYSTPHVTISCSDPTEVTLAFLCLESINFELKPPQKIIEKLETHKPEVKIPKERPTPPPKAPEKPTEVVERKEEIAPEKREAEIGVVEVPELPEVPEAPKPAELKPEEVSIEVPTMDVGRIGKEIEELPEIPSPLEVMKEISEGKVEMVEEKPIPSLPPEVTPKVEEKVVEAKPVEKPVEAQRAPEIKVVLEKDEKCWSVAKRLKSIEWVDRCMILTPSEGRIIIAHDLGGEISEEDKSTVLNVAKAIAIMAKITEPRAFLVVGTNKSIVSILGSRTILLEFRDNRALPLALSMISGVVEVPQHPIGVPVETVTTKFKLNIDDKAWETAKKMKRTIRGVIDCYIVSNGDGEFSIAHDGERSVTKNQEEFISNIINMVRIMENILKIRALIIFGKQYIMVAKKRGYIIVRASERPPLALLSAIATAS